jgi:hypothetical protein
VAGEVRYYSVEAARVLRLRPGLRALDKEVCKEVCGYLVRGEDVPNETPGEALSRRPRGGRDDEGSTSVFKQMIEEGWFALPDKEDEEDEGRSLDP